ncbi:site-2 protease family protein [Candidatus Woesearchaeota archaeon]|nr:site-2 protease family protein [Candidatus Woesearchaeota archaeon]
MKRSIKLGKYLGIDIYVHYSWLILLAVLTWGLATGWFPENNPGYHKVMYWGAALISTKLLFLSVLLHEMAHSYIAKKNGITVKSITLFLFGGMAGINEQKLTPGKELKMSIAGPVMSLALAALFYFISRADTFFLLDVSATYISRLNLVLAIFNMVPGFPLDGGRVFRAIVWSVTKDFKKATEMATTAGKAFAYFLIFIGLISIFSAGISAIWLVLIGLFLLMLSTLSYDQVVIRDALTGKRIQEFARKRYKSINPHATLQSAYETLKKTDKKMLPVMDGKKINGIIKINQILNKDKDTWGTLRAKDVMTPASRMPKSKPNTHAYKAFVLMATRGLDFLPVNNQVVFLEDLMRYVKLKVTKERLSKSGFTLTS